MRAALTDGTTVVNVIEYDPEQDYDPGDLELVELSADELVGPGYRVTADGFAPGYPEGLTATPDTVAVDEPALTRFVDYTDTAPAAVTFDVNGATATVDLTDGVAELEVTPSVAGPVTIGVDVPNVPAVTITAEEA